MNLLNQSKHLPLFLKCRKYRSRPTTTNEPMRRRAKATHPDEDEDPDTKQKKRRLVLLRVFLNIKKKEENVTFAHMQMVLLTLFTR